MTIKENVAKNIQALRKHKKLTQLELAEKVNYSDKAVSRWESGDVTPDIETLEKLSIVFEVPLAKLLEENLDIVKTEKETMQKKINKVIIALLGITIIWTMATIIYVYSSLIESDNSWIGSKNNWQIFIYAFPATFFVALIFTFIWGKRTWCYILLSALVWTVLLSIYIAYLSYNMWPLFILGAPLQIVIILWTKLKS